MPFNFIITKIGLHLHPLILLSIVFRAFEDEAKARLGVVECAKHELVQPFTVLQEKEGERHCVFRSERAL